MDDHVCPECGMSEEVSLRWLPDIRDVTKKVYFLYCNRCELSSNIKGDFISVILESKWTEENFKLRRKMKNEAKLIRKEE